MTLFLLTFFLVYGGLHLYFFRRLRAAFTLSMGRQFAVGAVLLLLVSAPLLVRVAERRDYEITAGLLSHVGYLWMALLLLFFAVSLCLECYRLAVYLHARIGRRDLSRLFPSARFLFLAPLAAATVIPNAAIRREGNQAGVWRLVDGDPQFVAVKLGRADLDGNVQVLEGLAEGDRIVVYSAQALGPRTRINVVERIPGVD